jgi:hypothetical protein
MSGKIFFLIPNVLSNGMCVGKYQLKKSTEVDYGNISDYINIFIE